MHATAKPGWHSVPVPELLLMLVAVAGGWPLPLLPVQLLWINLVTDGLPALALATDRIDPDVLARPPRRPERELVDRHFLVRIATIGALTSAMAFAAFLWELGAGRDLAAARNASFSVLVFAIEAAKIVRRGRR